MKNELLMQGVTICVKKKKKNILLDPKGSFFVFVFVIGTWQ